MFLRSLTLKGFKSFADPTTFDLEPGLTAVVGPNGSGKSNIVDAVDLRIEKQPHAPWNERRISSGRGSLKSSGTSNCPLSRPKARSVPGSTGTSLATARSPLRMTISSPSATRRSKRDKWVFASCTPTSTAPRWTKSLTKSSRAASGGRI